jgi:hypothetical protein
MKTRLIAFASVAFLAACGGSSATSSSKTASPNAAGSATTLVATATTKVGAPATTVTGSATTTTGQTVATLTADQITAAQAYRQCLRDNGAQIGGRGLNGQGGQAPAGGGSPAPGQAPADGVAPAPAGGGQAPAGGTPTSVDPAVLKTAQAACVTKLPTGMDATTAMNARGQGGQRTQVDPTIMAAYISCLKDNGVTVAATTTTIAATTATTATTTSVAGDRGPNGPNGGRGGQLAGIDRTSPEFIAANEKCKVLLPNDGAGIVNGPSGGQGGAPGGGPTTTTATGTTSTTTIAK